MKRRTIDGFFGTPIKTKKSAPRAGLTMSASPDVFVSSRDHRPAIAQHRPKPQKRSLPPRSSGGLFIDGFVNKPHLKRVYITRETAPTDHRFVSVRPSLQTAPVPGADITAPSRQPQPRRTLRTQEVVVKLPKRYTIRASLFSLVQYLVLAGVAVAAAYSTLIGQWFVLAYALFAIFTRQDSRLTFGVALFVLISVPFFQVFNQPGVSNNMAVYVYELLVVGTIQALIELKWPKREKPASARSVSTSA